MSDKHRILLFDIDGTLVSHGRRGRGRLAARVRGAARDPRRHRQVHRRGHDRPRRRREDVRGGARPQAVARTSWRRSSSGGSSTCPRRSRRAPATRCCPACPSGSGSSAARATCSGSSPATATAPRSSSSRAATSMRWFTFGAYASAGVDRPEIVRAGGRARRGDARRGRAQRRRSTSSATRRSTSARPTPSGCTAIAVATGHYDAAALRDAGADHVLETLEEELPHLAPRPRGIRIRVSPARHRLSATPGHARVAGAPSRSSRLRRRGRDRRRRYVVGRRLDRRLVQRPAVVAAFSSSPSRPPTPTGAGFSGLTMESTTSRSSPSGAGLDHHGAARHELALEHEVGQRVLDVALDRPAQRAGAHRRVPALLDEEVLRALGQLELQVALGQRRRGCAAAAGRRSA